MEVDSVIDVVKKSGSRSSSSQLSSKAPPLIAGASWRPEPNEPRLMLEREVLKARLQMPALVYQWREIEANAFTHPAYQRLRTFIDSQKDLEQIDLSTVESEELKSFITELSVEPIRTTGEVSDKYVSSITARLNEVALSRSIAEIKSTLQRLNPVDNEKEYNEIFTRLVAMETKRHSLRELALGEGLT
jgi:DNA primase